MVYALGLVLYEPQAATPLGKWVAGVAVGRGLRDDLDEVRSHSFSDGVTALQAVTTSVTAVVSAQQQTEEQARCIICLVVVIFWDGQAEQSRASLTELKQLSDHKWLAGSVASWGEQVEVVVQALNAKKGEASIMSNEAALVASLRKKLLSSNTAAKGLWKEGRPDRVGAARGAALHGDSASAAASSTTTTATTSPAQQKSGAVVSEMDLSPDGVSRAVEKEQGECFFLLSGPNRQEVVDKTKTLQQSCAAAAVGCSAVMPEPREIHRPHVAAAGTTAASDAEPSAAASTATAASQPAQLFAQEFLLRRCCPPATHLELRIAMCGNVDSGKSTLTSVLTRGCRDDGRGLARAFVFNHKHEATTGRTSSISENHLGLSATGGVVNYALLQPHKTDVELQPVSIADVARQLAATSTEGGEKTLTAAAEGTAAGVPPPPPPFSSTPAAAPPHSTRQYTPQELASRSSKVVTLYDLAGHERYLKTTVLGMTRNMPDYACIVVSANNGIQRMTKEHLALCLALKLPFFVVVTRIDSTPPNVREETLASIQKLLKIPTVRKLPYPVRRHDEVILAAKNLRHDRIAPIFEVSNVTGHGIADVLQFINLLPVRKDWRLARQQPKEMIIDSTFFVTGVGTVVGGIITQGVFRVNDTVLLGPDGFGHFRPVAIKSIHIKGVDSMAAEAGSDAALCLKKEKRSAIRKGNVLVDAGQPPKSFWQFEAEITILYHSTTITANYEPVIHSTTVRQSARITYVAQEILRTGDKSLARFHFLYRPEYMKEGQRLIFREGRTKGIGTVTKLSCERDEYVLVKKKLRKKMQEKPNAPVAAR